MSAPHDARPATPPRWSSTVRALVSLFLAWHLLALLVGPWSVPQPTILAFFLRPFYRPYLQAAYLDHGYMFFAPDPGPSHLVRYDLELADGSHRTGVFPDRERHWPRLLYHRHFMLSEFLAGLPPPPGVAPAGDARFEDLPASPAQQRYARSYAAHLIEKHQARRVTLYLVQHLIPAPRDVMGGMALDDPRLYRTRGLGTFERGRP